MPPIDHLGTTRIVTPPPPPPASLSIDDVWFVVFRNKWIISISFAASVLAAALFVMTNKPMYLSQAKLLVRYVVDTKSLNPMAAAHDVRSPDNRGDNIMNSELEIITSFDLLGKVVDAVGASNILGRAMGGNAKASAAAYPLAAQRDAPQF
ncbi:MAG: Wzz/FepE/Etk N-terminal domain-containing protein [Limisphaerales bacterium]